MRGFLIVLLGMVLVSSAQDHIFIRDYFLHKRVRNVVGFSCGDTIGDFNLLRTLSTTGVYTIIREPSVKIDFRRFLRSDTWTVGVIVDLRCHNETAVRIFAEGSKYRMYDYSYNWLVLGSNYNQSLSLLNDTAYNMVTDLVLAISNNRGGYDLYDVYNHCKYRGGSLNVTELGTWRGDLGLSVTLTQPLINRRANMHGMRLKISGVIQYRPKDMRLEDYMQDINTRSLDSMHKFVYAMILHTGDLFNFSVHASEIIYWDRHSVHGLIFEFLQANYIDFASNPRIMVSERLDYASLIGAAWPIRPCFMLLSTSTNKIKLEIFLKPFTRQTWYTFAAFGLFCIFVVKLIMNQEGIGKKEKYSGAVVLSVGILSQQGANLFPKRVACRIALFQMTIHGWIMYNYYSGSIISARLSEPLDMMEDSVTVLADSNLKIAAEAVPYLNYFLYKLNWESDYFRTKRWDPLPESKRYLPIEEGIKQVSQGILAYHTDPNTAYPYVERMFDSNKICELTEIHLFKQSVMGMYASHNGQFVEMAKIGLTKMFNTGLRDRQIKHWSSRKPQCQPDTLSTRSITIYETAPALILLAFGMIMAGGICISENIIYKRSRFLIQNGAIGDLACGTNALHAVARLATNDKVQPRKLQVATEMLRRGIFCLQLIVASCATSIDVVHDYFPLKKITRVVGFSCGGYGNDQKIIRSFNDAGILVSTKTLGSNVDIQRSLRTDYWNLGVFVDLRCSVADEDVVNIFDEASRYYMFGHLHQWLILGRNMEHTVQLLNDSTFSITTDFVISLPRDDGYILYDIYNHCKHCGGPLSITNFGTWDRETGLNVTLLEGKFSRRRDFQQIKVKSAGVVAKRPADQDLIEYLTERNAMLEDNWPKFGYSLLVNVAYMYNFSLEMIELNYWPPNDRNGPLMSGLRDRLFDLGYYPSILTQERLGLCDVTLQVWPSRTCFMFRTLPSQKVDMNIIFRPLEKKVWYTFCVLSVVMVLILRVIFKLENESHYGETVFVIIGAMCQQGLPFENNKLSSRVASLQTLIFGLLMYNCYSAAIVSSRLNNGPANKMNDSLTSLVKSRMKLSTYKTTFFNILISTKTADVQYFRKHWETIPERVRYQPLMEGIRGIMNPGFAYHTDPNIVYPLIERMFSNDMISQLTEVHLLRPSALGLWSAPRGQFQEIVKIGLIRTYTAGIRRRELLRWTSRKPYYNKINREASSVTIIETMPILLLLIFGMVVSLVICILENIVFRTFPVHANRKK